jgi:uncharacterized protein (DUF433 family)
MIPEPLTMHFPLKMDNEGAIRVGETRITLDIVIARYHQGDTPEAIHKGFDVLPLNTIYAVIAYYLAHQDELDIYLQGRVAEAERIRQATEANYNPQQKAFMERLRAVKRSTEDQ